MKQSLLVIEDDPLVREMLHDYFRPAWSVYSAESGGEGLVLFQKSAPAAVILDLRLPDMSGFDVLRELRSIDSEPCIVMLTGYGDIESAVQAIKLGASNFLTKPVDIEALEAILEKAVRHLRLHESQKLLSKRLEFMKGGLLLDDETLEAVGILQQNSSATVLITGPTGSGKGALAELIHKTSSRAAGPFVDVNCAGLSESLLESELFGHEKGSFTGAASTKKGLFEAADGGALFLDEIGEMPLSVQAKVLKAIESKKFRRLGGTVGLETDVRIIAATNTDILEKIRRGAFREDLYYRLNIIPIELKPLANRKDDIRSLSEMVLKEMCARMNKTIEGFTDPAMSLLVGYAWPGNIRELRNIIERAAILCPGGRIDRKHLPGIPRRADEGCDLDGGGPVRTLDEIEKEHIASVLKLARNNKSKAAKLLGISVKTLYRKVEKYGIGLA